MRFTRFLLLLIALGFVVGWLFGAVEAPEKRWVVNTEVYVPHDLEVTRGESATFKPTFRNYGVAMDLSGGAVALMRYKSEGMTNYYVVTGRVDNATGGVVEIPWTSLCEGPADVYAYEISVQGLSVTFIRTGGDLSIKASVGDDGTATNAPVSFSEFDWASVEHVNIGSAPFLSAMEIADIRAFDATLLDGTADLDVHSIVSDHFSGNADGLSNFPEAVAMDLVSGGQSEVPGVSRTGSNQYTIVFPLSSSGETLSSNRLVWTVDGITMGYVNSNGITMIRGSLQLYDEDLNCNVQAYDGSRQEPSLTFVAQPTIGWYRKSYGGGYAWCYTYNSNDVLLLNGSGITLLGAATIAGNIPEALFSAWTTNASLKYLTLTNSGSLTIKDTGGSTRFSVSGSDGATVVRGQDTDARYLMATNGLTTNYVFYSVGSNGTGVVTNTVAITNGQIRSWLP